MVPLALLIHCSSLCLKFHFLSLTASCPLHSLLFHGVSSVTLKKCYQARK